MKGTLPDFKIHDGRMWFRICGVWVDLLDTADHRDLYPDIEPYDPAGPRCGRVKAKPNLEQLDGGTFDEDEA
jgi:hypothetical protein